MNIAIMINELNVRGGTQKQVLRLAEFLIRNEHNVTIFTKQYEYNKTYPDFSDYRVIELNKNKENSLFSVCRYLASKFDIINIHDNGFSRYIIVLGMLYRKRIVWQINDLPMHFRVGAAKDTEKRISDGLLCLVSRLAARYVSRITVNVSKNQRLVEKCLKKNAQVLYCGVDKNPRLRIHENIQDKNAIHLLTVGVFMPYRNYETIIDVVYKLRANNYNAFLNIVGEEKTNIKYANQIKKHICDKKLENYVTICGGVTEYEYTELFDKTDIFLFININQSWGLAVFEAMSCGIPTIVSDSVGAIELLTNDFDSIIVDPLDVDLIYERIIKLKTDEKYYKTISSNSIVMTKKFTWDELYSSKMLSIFQEEVNYL